MSQKKTKQTRRKLRTITAAIDSLLPQVELELNHNNYAIYEWIKMAVATKLENDEIPISDLLPSKLGLATNFSIFVPSPDTYYSNQGRRLSIDTPSTRT